MFKVTTFLSVYEYNIIWGGVFYAVKAEVFWMIHVLGR